MNANIAERIKTAREERGLTQEQLAERLEVSRQAVSKWEMGLSVPSSENLQLLEEILGISLPKEEEEPPEKKKNPWKPAALILSVLLAVLAAFVVHASRVEAPASAADAGPPVPRISGVYFFDQTGQPLTPDQGDGWKQLKPEEPTLLLIRFQDYGGGVNAAVLYFTPSGTETLDQRRQLAVQAAEGRDFALFPLELPQDAMGHLDIVLECGGGVSVTETLNVLVVSQS
jgi:transcriptional regulator with XRE-family HTH domain